MHDRLDCMSQVETVALWAGLIASIAGITLSIVATIFALWVSKQSAAVNQQMIKSLQKIETTVEHLSADTRELITAGWNKMLSGIGGESDDDASTLDVTDQISEGVASEVQSELKDDQSESASERVERLENALEDLKETLAVQLRRTYSRESQNSITALVGVMIGLPIEARALLSILSRGYHLTRKQYLLCTKNQLLRVPLKKLRAGGLIVPLKGLTEDGDPEPCYYFPPRLTKQIKVATQLSGDIPKEIMNVVASNLRSVGYSPSGYNEHLVV